MSLGATKEEILKKAAEIIGVKENYISYFEIARESIDSRKKNNIKMIYIRNINVIKLFKNIDFLCKVC